jgi:hypothetical protein
VLDAVFKNMLMLESGIDEDFGAWLDYQVSLQLGYSFVSVDTLHDQHSVLHIREL